MKKQLLLTRMLLLVALLVGSTSVWADDILKETLDFTDASVKAAGYTSTSQWNSTWTLYGGNNNNKAWAYVRFGGKASTSGTATNGTATIYTTAKIENAIDYVVIEHLGVNGKKPADFSVTSIVLETSSSSDFSNATTTSLTSYDVASSTTTKSITITPTNQVAKDSYYRIKINWSSTNTNNMGLDVQKVKLYQNAPAYTITAQSNNNSYGTVSLSGSVITANPADGYRVSTSTPYTVNPANSATVSQNGNAFTVTPSDNTTVTINFEAIPTHTLNTAVAPVNSGTITLDATSVKEGATATATAAANTGYKFTGWSIIGEGATLSSTSANPTTVTMGTDDATITANFVAVTTYAITWNVNGVNVRKDNVEEDADIDFPTSISGVPTGYELLGWVVEANKIDGTTDTDPSSNFVTEATSTANITYYAVMAVADAGSETATIELTSTEGYSGSYSEQVFTDDKGNTWSGSVAVSNQDDKPCIQMKTSSGGSAITSPTFPGVITSIKMLARNGSSKNSRSFNFNSAANTNNGDLGTLEVPANHKYAAELTATLNSEFTKFYLWVTDNLGFNKISVTYNSITYKNYCTTVPTATVTLAAACNDGEETPTYYGTYSNDKAFVVPADMTVSTIKVANSKLVVTAYDEGDIVKAGTGVMVSSATSGAHTITLAAGGSEVEGNMLYASGDAGIDADGMAAIVDDCKYYRLTMHGYVAGVNPGVIGYYWGAADGAAFALAANKAFLAVPTALAKEGFSFITGEEETDGIKAVSTTVENGVRYNLAGQKVGADYKGIVIVNGKKVIIK